MGVEDVNEQCITYCAERMFLGVSWSDVRDEIEIAYDADPTWSTNTLQPVVLERLAALYRERGVGEHDELTALRLLVTPVISSITPATGDPSGGELVVIVGTGFVPGLTVTIGGHAQTVVSVRPTRITFRTVAHAAASAADVVVTNPSTNDVTETAAFAFAKVTPVFTSITPTSGPAAGGTICHIIGTDFTPGMTVTIGAHACKVLSQTGTTNLCIRTPAHAAGALDVVITAKNTDSDTDVGGFTYV